ncbi:hypothetical protein [Streptomyces sp. NPDC060010]|uniref:hypothetical protein n=1 Tax=Streptomyces sp. NPDC060010 TaxID=3347036 RepID=UPI0036C857C5
MAKTKGTLVIGATLILLAVGCDSENSPDGNSTPSGRPPLPLSKLQSISVDADPLGDLEDRPQILSEVQYEDVRLIAYVTRDSCGIITTPRNDPQRSDIHLVSKWPSIGQGTDPYPAGPYNSASGNGSAKTWASLLCSQDAMVIEYTPATATSNAGKIRGEATATPLRNNRAVSQIVIGDPTTRMQIQHQADESRISTANPSAS